MFRLYASVLSLIVFVGSTSRGGDFPRFERRVIDPHVGEVCYALTTADVDGDSKLDVVALSENAVVAYTAPSWTKHVLLKDKTERDNVCIQANDIDGDGRIDFALGAAWRPTDTKTGGSLQWISRGRSGDDWRVMPISSEPTLHRMRWADIFGTGKKQLIVAPLQGRGTKGPNWGEGQGTRILAFSVPDRPAEDPWPVELIDDSLHTAHNLWVHDLDDDGKPDIVVAAWEGVFVFNRGSDGKWRKTKLGAGNQDAKPFKGASEVKVGRLADGSRYIATIEPWHGFQTVVYTPPKIAGSLWDRHVIDQPVQWGHGVWVANLDDDKDEELIIGQRDKNKPGVDHPAGPGVYVFDPVVKAGEPLAFERHVIDDGGVAVEDVLAADLDGDGREDLVAGGRATHNVVVYFNRLK
jgi:hypothetical protein